MIELDYQIAFKDFYYPQKSEILLWLNTAYKILELKSKFELTIRIVDNAEIQELNKTYRAKDYPTNVLSFPFDDNLLPNLLGDIVIASQIIKKEAEEQAKELQHHWTHIIIHGFLHLLGYDHIEDEEAEEMEGLEIKILKELNIKNPYIS